MRDSVAVELDNPAWSALTTFQAHLARGGDHVKRYPVDVAQIGAIGSWNEAAREEMDLLVPEGDWISFPSTIEHADTLVPPALRITKQGHLVQMIETTSRGVPALDVEAVLLSEADAPDMIDLADRTRPGPFCARTFTFGTFLGIRDRGRLVAMAGQRMHLPGFREISAVCTLPEFRGRGYARHLVALLAGMIRGEGLTPFLHVEESNLRAQALYSSMGFVERRRLPLLVVGRA